MSSPEEPPSSKNDRRSITGDMSTHTHTHTHVSHDTHTHTTHTCKGRVVSPSPPGGLFYYLLVVVGTSSGPRAPAPRPCFLHVFFWVAVLWLWVGRFGQTFWVYGLVFEFDVEENAGWMWMWTESASGDQNHVRGPGKCPSFVRVSTLKWTRTGHCFGRGDRCPG